jgi:hypothetical protein
MITIDPKQGTVIDTYAANNGSGARHVIRFSARLNARLRIALDRLNITTDMVIMDISSDGVSAAVSADLRAGSRVQLEIPRVGWRDAEVRWLKGGRAGCRFVAPLSTTELRAAVAVNPPIRDNFPGLADQLDGA